MINSARDYPIIPKVEELATLIPWQTPTWKVAPEDSGKIKATWLGCVLEAWCSESSFTHVGSG
jgi:hypothetical protein